MKFDLDILQKSQLIFPHILTFYINLGAKFRLEFFW